MPASVTVGGDAMRPMKRWREARDLATDTADILHSAVRWGFADARFVNAAARACIATGRGMARRLLRRLEADDRRALLDRRDDLEALARLPDTALGGHHLRYLDRFGLPPIHSLLDAIEIEARATRYGWSDAERWVIRRVFEEHDLWHVLCDYGADPAGEWHLNAFSYPSLGNRTTFVFGFAAPLISRPEDGWRACTRGLLAAYRRGTRPHASAWMFAAGPASARPPLTRRLNPGRPRCAPPSPRGRVRRPAASAGRPRAAPPRPASGPGRGRRAAPDPTGGRRRRLRSARRGP